MTKTEEVVSAADETKAVEEAVEEAAAESGSEIATAEEEKKEEAPKKEKKKYIDWPLRDIKEPHDNDVLYGRGGGTNHHLGNKRYRKMVDDRKVDYVNCKRLDKPLVALEIIREWRGQDPPGRFLKMDDKTGLWNDVGDKKAREKTSQALREKAPQIRMELERERRDHGQEGESDEEGDLPKSTRFADGTHLHDGPAKPGVVRRDHSLGQEYLSPEEEIGLEGFSWQDPVCSSGMERTSSQGIYCPPEMPYLAYAPVSSVGSGYPVSSIGSHASFPPPPHASWGRYESWGSLGPPPPMGYAYPPTQSGAWAREHSLGQNPLQHASVSHAAYPHAFDHTRSDSWGPPHPPYPYPPMRGPPPHGMSSGRPPPPTYGHHPPREFSGTQPPREFIDNQPPREFSEKKQPPQAPLSPNYDVDPAVASQWSGQDPREIAKSLSESSADEQQDSFRSTPASPPPRKSAPVPKPDIAKRATSNQNETLETKRDLHGKSVKRCTLNREGSLASARLKEKCMPGYFDSKKEVEILSTNLKQSTLGSCNSSSLDGIAAAPRPWAMSRDERMTTLDMNALDLVMKPITLGATSRSSTIDALNIDFDDDRFVSSMEDVFSDARESTLLSRPSTLTVESRLTTTDLFDIVNEPISEV